MAKNLSTVVVTEVEYKVEYTEVFIVTKQLISIEPNCV